MMTTNTDPGAPTLAEDLLLLLFQPRHGTIAGEGTLFYVLAGAVLAELGLDGNVETDTAGATGTLRIRAVADHPPGDPLLRPAWDYVTDKPRGVQTVLAAVGPALRSPVLERLEDRGDIARTSRKLLGLIDTTSLAPGPSGRRDELMAGVRAVLVDGAQPDARTAALAALLSGSGTLPQFDREIGWNSAVITRAKELEQGNWGADAAAQAVARTVAATIVNNVVVAAAVAGRA
ncbi:MULTISPECIES: GOLPH3/VPS74 family protein [Microbacterium]|uniref:GOLPH3/VPS74 family protein n=1 Tax=Microbacterium TaxID=33882 RepID=UPI00344BFAF9